ncbi:MAG: hypothetical protein R6U98_08525, partial [Pirellulaceae bacterium]
HGCRGLVPWWFTLAATNRPDTPLLAVGSVERNGPRDKPAAFAPRKAFPQYVKTCATDVRTFADISLLPVNGYRHGRL